MARPAGTPPTWATDANYTATEPTDPHDGNPNKVEPTSGQKANGFEPRYRAPAQFFNWLFSRISLWLEYVVGFIDASDEFVYPTTKSRKRVYGVGSFRPDVATEWDLTIDGAGAGHLASPTANNAKGQFTIDHLPQGATVTAVEVLLGTSANRGTAADRWQVRLFKTTRTFDGTLASSATQVGSTLDDAGGAASIRKVSFNSLSEAIGEGNDLVVGIEGPNGSLAAGDYLYGVRVTFNDPGPRNF